MIDYNQAVEEYYSLKSKYDEKVNDYVSKVMRNPSLTPSSRRDKIRTYKRKCIMCGRAGGTLFSNQNGILSAVCGHIKSPCPLDIRIERKQVQPSYSVAEASAVTLENDKQNIIRSKLDLLFQYEEEDASLRGFNKHKSAYESDSKEYLRATDAYFNVSENPNRQSELKKADISMFVMKNGFADLIKDYVNNENSESALRSATNMYVNEIMPEANKIRQLKYRQVEMISDMETQTYKLVEEPWTVENMEIVVNNESGKVLSFKLK